MSELSVLDEIVPRQDEQPDWDDVLRRARGRRPTARVLVAALVAVAVIGVAPAVAVVLLRGHPLDFPRQADRNNIVVVIQPRTGRLVLELAPRKDGKGFCYLLRPFRAGCVTRSKQTVLMSPPLFGWTFDARVRSGVATTASGKTVPLYVQHFGGRVDATIFMTRGRLVAGLLRTVTLRDAAGKPIIHLRGR